MLDWKKGTTPQSFDEKMKTKTEELKDQVGRFAKFKWVGILIAVILVILIGNPSVIIRAGQWGVVLDWGAVQKEVLGEGLHIRIPVYQQAVKIDVRIQVTSTHADAVSKDMQQNHSKIAVNYHNVPAEAGWVYQNLGPDYKVRMIDPKIQEIVKAVTARCSALELVSKRAEVRNEIKELLKSSLMPYRIVVDDFWVVTFK